jgi:hypothetical protein
VVANPQYNLYLRLLTISDEELYDEFLKNKKEDATNQQENPLTPLELLLNCAYHSEALKTNIEEAFMLFTHRKPVFLYNEKKIIVGELG